MIPGETCVELLDTVRSRRNPVIFDKRDRFVFFPNNKVCQTSITQFALKRRVIVRKFHEASWNDTMQRVDEEYLNRVFTFTIVRNPFDRAVSAYKQLKRLRVLPSDADFSTFCAEVLAIHGVEFDPHLDPQSDGLFHDGHPIVDVIARYERIDEDWKRIARLIGLARTRFPHANRSARRQGYTSHYDDESRAIVARTYADDVTLFGYAFGEDEAREAGRSALGRIRDALGV